MTLLISAYQLCFLNSFYFIEYRKKQAFYKPSILEEGKNISKRQILQGTSKNFSF
ncbi:hypothetical protein TREVI0001_1568 [Treponema vincentii ATCC 35580]|uniref:Uncharacterized protein n=1 Tax=Treponema vincentii ATCC 35580 TaxID=596324 RepID=C8PN64_9SPIR|nr:hypothetical protein TREVI0001_1568 [Treponema vincentii ATCC 35580]